VGWSGERGALGQYILIRIIWQGPRGHASVQAALRLIWAEAWLDCIDDVAVHLAAQDDARPGALAYASR
jgi:hypothetical protein